MLVAAIAQRDALEAENARLRRELIEIVAGHQDERRAHEEYRQAVAASRAAEQELLELHPQRAEGVSRGEAPRHVLH